MRIAASVAEGVPVDLAGAVRGVDHGNAVVVARTVLHAAGHRGATVPLGGTG